VCIAYPATPEDLACEGIRLVDNGTNTSVKRMIKASWASYRVVFTRLTVEDLRRISKLSAGEIEKLKGYETKNKNRPSPLERFHRSLVCSNGRVRGQESAPYWHADDSTIRADVISIRLNPPTGAPRGRRRAAQPTPSG
jgi:hypothetical protein